jgi:hypothetical protein
MIMSPTNRRLLLRANAVFLLVASTGGMASDISAPSSTAATSRRFSPERRIRQ